MTNSHWFVSQEPTINQISTFGNYNNFKFQNLYFCHFLSYQVRIRVIFKFAVRFTWWKYRTIKFNCFLFCVTFFYWQNYIYYRNLHWKNYTFELLNFTFFVLIGYIFVLFIWCPGIVEFVYYIITKWAKLKIYIFWDKF